MTGKAPVGKTHAGTGGPLWWCTQDAEKGLEEDSKEKGRPFQRDKSCDRLQRTTGRRNRIYMFFENQMAAIRCFDHAVNINQPTPDVAIAGWV